ncbi:MAG: hypothetical protein H8E32_07185 [Nitrospinae bacterium]|nr:hypothetical protein [Nitrospinota bacterium]
MSQEFKIELDDQVLQQLKKLCTGDKNAMEEYIVQALKDKINQNKHSHSPDGKDDLESYLNKGQPGSRNYGVKGQGW